MVLRLHSCIIFVGCLIISRLNCNILNENFESNHQFLSNEVSSSKQNHNQRYHHQHHHLSAVIISHNETRYNHTRAILEEMKFHVVQKVPINFTSQLVDDDLSKRNFKVTEFPHSQKKLRQIISNALTFIDALESFGNESSNKSLPSDWRFFFEDDIAVHPTIVKPSIIIKKSLHIAAADGLLYLGVCGPTCSDEVSIVDEVEIRKCFGVCAHAFAVSKWMVKSFITSIQEMRNRRYRNKRPRFAFDEALWGYGEYIKTIYVVGSNLTSPLVSDHKGMIYQDRVLYPTTITD